MLAEEHNEPDTDGAAALQADDASVTGGSPGQAGAAADTDAHSTATGVTETQQMGRVSPQRGWRPSTMDNIQLCNWMEQMGASKETLARPFLSDHWPFY